MSDDILLDAPEEDHESAMNHVNALRHIITTDLGVSRAEIRSEMCKIVEQCVKSEVQRIFDHGKLMQSLVSGEILKLCGKPSGFNNSVNPIKTIVEQEAQKLIKEYIATHIHISPFGPLEPTQSPSSGVHP